MIRRLPKSLSRLLKSFSAYVLRLRLWSKVLPELRFVASATGRNGLRRSLLFAPLTSLRGLGEFRNLVLLEDATVQVKDVGLFHLRAHSDDLYVALPSSEASVLEYIRSQLRPGDVFVDAGANIGIYTIVGSAAVGPEGIVVAIEMMPETFDRLRTHVEMNNCLNVILVNKAVSDRSGGHIPVTVPADGRHGKASIVTGCSGSMDQTVLVETQSLNDILGDVPKIQLMKMDLEGAEALAVRGATQVLGRIDRIVFECWDAEHDISPVLEKQGFRVRRLDARNLIAER